MEDFIKRRNQKRAARAMRAVREHNVVDGVVQHNLSRPDELATALVDLVCDLMHLAESEQVNHDWFDLTETAKGHYEAEQVEP